MSAAGTPLGVELSGPGRRLDFVFVDRECSSGTSAWQADGVYEVAASCRSFHGGFHQQALNRPVALDLLEKPASVLLLQGMAGCLLDLPRVAAILDTPTIWLIDEALPAPSDCDPNCRNWIVSCLQACRALVALNETSQAALSAWNVIARDLQIVQVGNVQSVLEDVTKAEACSQRRYSYATYEFCQRDHTLLARMQIADTVHFEGCQRVLDLGCGVGIFLDCLRRSGLSALGVERDPVIAEYGRGMGLEIKTADALDYVETVGGQFDGVYCSHFVEHLNFSGVEKLIGGIANALKPGGIAVFTFPDPESIRSQLLGFWRDPEHVRFYHPDLITALASSFGLRLEWSSYQAQPHRLVPFPEEPVSVSSPVPLDALEFAERPLTVGERLLSKLGWVKRGELEAQQQIMLRWSEQLRHSLARQQEVSLQLQERTERLWEVNRTWAWDDNATLRLRKRV